MKVLSSTKNGAEILRQNITRAASIEDAQQLKILEGSCKLVLRKNLSSPILLEKRLSILSSQKAMVSKTGSSMTLLSFFDSFSVRKIWNDGQ